MKTPGIDEIREALDTDDPLNLVNSFNLVPYGGLEKECYPYEFHLNDYWQHRTCALAELVFEKLREQRDEIASLKKRLAASNKKLNDHQEYSSRQFNQDYDNLPYGDYDERD